MQAIKEQKFDIGDRSLALGKLRKIEMGRIGVDSDTGAKPITVAQQGFAATTADVEDMHAWVELGANKITRSRIETSIIANRCLARTIEGMWCGDDGADALQIKLH